MIRIIGGGLAGSEAAYQLAKRGHKVILSDMKPKKSPAHSMDTLCELVCSNSLKSDDISTASGLLKHEMRLIGSLILEAAENSKVPAGGALSVDRKIFSQYVDNALRNNENIIIESVEVDKIDEEEYTIIATGPLTSDSLITDIQRLTGESLHFYDAAAPIVSLDSIDMTKAFRMSRYDKGGDDYINCPMDKDEYLAFYDALVVAKRAELHEFEKNEIYEGCMPIEIMAGRGVDTIRFGPLKPVGLIDPKTERRPYAVVQLRQDNIAGSMYNLVGFQTNLTFKEQRRVFGMIPALANAEFERYGVMHRNTYINSPRYLNNDFSMKTNEKIYFAGQITGVEGYMESTMSGMLAGISLANKIEGKVISFPSTTMCGALSNYISNSIGDFQPMNANFGILPPLVNSIRDKVERKRALSDRAIMAMNETLAQSMCKE